jgi:hypothetical protein
MGSTGTTLSPDATFKPAESGSKSAHAAHISGNGHKFAQLTRALDDTLHMAASGVRLRSRCEEHGRRREWLD